ncbi:MAG: pilus assembly protein TadG-related protein [Ilumatobacter sp.]|jgi:Flp pilus assembly protein TadG|uniref:pilus assembly protein TadG-related protein n=1 Tax=Ilumatobacter sp. TaxID=1967498 RepID=UPI0039199BF0
MRDETTATNHIHSPHIAATHTGSARPTWCRGDIGQAAIVVVAVAAALLVAILLALVDVGRGVTDRARAQTAADAAALASLDGGEVEAARFAAHHGATLVSWRAGPGADEVTVVVRFGEATATARATDAP